MTAGCDPKHLFASKNDALKRQQALDAAVRQFPSVIWQAKAMKSHHVEVRLDEYMAWYLDYLGVANSIRAEFKRIMTSE